MDSQQHRDAINTQLAGFFRSNATNESPGGFSFSEPQIRAVINNYLDLARSYDESIAAAAGMTLVEGPGRDFASKSFAKAANQSGHSLVESFANARDYCYEQAQLAQNALDDYLGVEHTNVTTINQAPQGPQAGV